MTTNTKNTASSSYLENILSKEKDCDGIWKEYKAEFIKYGFDKEATLKFLVFKDLTERVQMKLAEARLLWNVLVKQGLCTDSKCPICGSHVTSASKLFDKAAKGLKKALPYKKSTGSTQKSPASTKVSDDPNMPNATTATTVTKNSTTLNKNSTPPALPTPTSSISCMYKVDFDGIVKYLMKNSKQGYGPYPIRATRSSDAVGTADDPLFNAKASSSTSDHLPSQGGQWWKFDFGKDFKVDPAKYVSVTLLTHSHYKKMTRTST